MEQWVTPGRYQVPHLETTYDAATGTWTIGEVNTNPFNYPALSVDSQAYKNINTGVPTDFNLKDAQLVIKWGQMEYADLLLDIKGRDYQKQHYLLVIPALLNLHQMTLQTLLTLFKIINIIFPFIISI